jgi:predicted amidohydrolase
LTDEIGGYAKKYNTYIIFTMNEKEGDAIYNTAVIIGRSGEICGKYRKTHLPLTEAEWGTSPGDKHCVFDLDFGRIGVLICYDQFFPENWRTLALMGAEIIFIPTMGEDELTQRAIARTNGVHVVVSGYDGAASSRIINPLGETVNFVKDKNTAYAAEKIDLNKRFFNYWMSIGPGNGETRSLFEKERMTAVYGAVTKESYKVKKSYFKIDMSSTDRQ